jgi:hypothetical protein
VCGGGGGEDEWRKSMRVRTNFESPSATWLDGHGKGGASKAIVIAERHHGSSRCRRACESVLTVGYVQ